MAQISAMYRRWKTKWDVSHSADMISAGDRKMLMNETLREDIARTRFFAERPAPQNWSLNAFIQTAKFPLRFSFAALKGRNTTEEVYNRRDIDTVKPRKWFKDWVINTYMGLLRGNSNPSSASCIFMPTYFYPRFTLSGPLTLGQKHVSGYVNASAAERYELVMRWTQGIDTLGKEKIFIPVNINNMHWILVYIDMRRKRVLSLDSFHRPRHVVRTDVLDWLEQEHLAKGVLLNRRKWASLQKKAPTQSDGYSCSPFVCLFAAFLSNDQPLSFKQSDVPAMRERIVWSVLNGSLV